MNKLNKYLYILVGVLLVVGIILIVLSAYLGAHGETSSRNVTRNITVVNVLSKALFNIGVSFIIAVVVAFFIQKLLLEYQVYKEYLYRMMEEHHKDLIHEVVLPLKEILKELEEELDPFTSEAPAYYDIKEKLIGESEGEEKEHRCLLYEDLVKNHLPDLDRKVEELKVLFKDFANARKNVFNEFKEVYVKELQNSKVLSSAEVQAYSSNEYVTNLMKLIYLMKCNYGVKPDEIPRRARIKPCRSSGDPSLFIGVVEVDGKELRGYTLCARFDADGVKKCSEAMLGAAVKARISLCLKIDNLMELREKVKQQIREIIRDLDRFRYKKSLKPCDLVK